MQTRTVDEIIAAKVTVNSITGCWDWLGQKHPNGYGYYHRHHGNGGHVSAHRMVYAHIKGEIPDGLTLDHLCRNRGCVNPDHLEPVAHRTNCLRGESPQAKNARKNTCVRGHELTGRNLYRPKDGSRQCRKCRVIRQSQYVERKIARAVEAYKKSL